MTEGKCPKEVGKRKRDENTESIECGASGEINEIHEQEDRFLTCPTRGCCTFLVLSCVDEMDEMTVCINIVAKMSTGSRYL